MKTLVTFLTIALVSCNMMAQSSAELKYNLEKNKVYRVKTSSTQDQKMTVQGMDRNTETKSTTYFSLKMLDAKPGFFIAEAKFDTMITLVSAPPMELNSSHKGDINSEDGVEVTKCILNRLSNSTILVRMDYKGHVLDIMNYNVIAENVLAGTDSLKGQAAMAKGQIEMLVKKDALIGMIEGITAYLPNEKVKKGAKWESSFVNVAGGVGMAITSNYVLKELEKSKAIIEANSIVEPASSEPTVMNGAEITNELSGLGKSTIEIDSETGWVIKASSKTQMSGNMHIKAPGQAFSMPLESIINSEITVIE